MNDDFTLYISENTMFLIKYEIKKHVDNSDSSFVIIGVWNKKLVSKKNLQKHLNDGWWVNRKYYVILTPSMDWWNKFDTNQKLTIIGITTGSIIAIITTLIVVNS